VVIAILFFSCKDNSAEKKFEISGTITNNKTLRGVYLEELPAGASQGTIVDSSLIDKDGHYKLKGGAKESSFYAVLADQNDEFALASLINDVPKVTLDIQVNDQNYHYSDKYEVKGSPASQAMKDYVSAIGDNLHRIYLISRQVDSLRKLNTPDSLLEPLMMEWKGTGEKIRDFSYSSFDKTNDPALFIFELGYYQKMAERFGLEPFNPEDEVSIVNKASEKFPSHIGLADVKKDRIENLARIKKLRDIKWVGREAPDFSLPDANGKEIKLSSFRGKYVLVDFWASWCIPCRRENPNVVKAFNRFKDKNFAILGVSLDNPGEKENWLNAVKKDNLTWTQVSDLKGWQSIVVPMFDFGEVGIPYNILLDPNGVVIGERLQGSALLQKLEEVLQ